MYGESSTAIMRRECEIHIAALTGWLGTHPPRDHWTPGQHQMRADRERSLKVWTSKLNLVTRPIQP